MRLQYRAWARLWRSAQPTSWQATCSHISKAKLRTLQLRWHSTTSRCGRSLRMHSSWHLASRISLTQRLPGASGSCESSSVHCHIPESSSLLLNTLEGFSIWDLKQRTTYLLRTLDSRRCQYGGRILITGVEVLFPAERAFIL